MLQKKKKKGEGKTYQQTLNLLGSQTEDMK